MAGKYQTHVETVDLIYLLLAVLSLVLNGLMIYISCLRRRKGWPIDVILLLMIGASELSAALLTSLLQLWKFNTSYTAVFNRSVWCYFSAVLIQGTLLTTLTLTATLALVRYLAIVRGKSVSNFSWTVFAALITLLCWLLMLLKIKSADDVVPIGVFCSSMDKHLSINLAFILFKTPLLIVIPTCHFFLTHHFHALLCQMREIYGADVPRIFRMRFYGMAVMAIIYFPIIFPEYIVEVLTIADFKPLAWVASMARICTFILTIANAVFALLYHEDINRELIRVIEQYDSRSQERLSHQAPVPDHSPKRDPDRTSTFLYLQ